DGSEYRVMPDLSARQAAFRAGQVEYGFSGTLTEIQALQRSNPDVKVVSDPPVLGANGLGMAMNVASPKFKDDRVRQALNLAVDRKRVTDTMYPGGVGRYLPAFAWPFVFDSRSEEHTSELQSPD